MNVKDTIKQLLDSIELTTDDTQKFQPRGSFADQVFDAIGRIMLLVDTGIRKTSGDKEFTVLKYADEDSSSIFANLVLAYDLHNIFLSTNKTDSLHTLGMGNNGTKSLQHLGAFTVDEIIPTGTWGFKYSRASQELGYTIDQDLTTDEWKSLRAKYNDDETMQVMRDDAISDISWLEIKHVFITPVEL